MSKQNDLCMICGADCKYYFTKKFNLELLQDVEYYKCTHCGFVYSNTHKKMSAEKWNDLNKWYHSYHGTNVTNDDKNWTNRLNTQSDIIKIFVDNNLLCSNGNWIDYGCGDGKLSNMLENKYNLILKKFDIVPVGSGFISEQELYSKKYDFVITTSVFEHLRTIEELNNIFSLVSETGIMAVHTFISENVPQDPTWFYLLPVHCAFFTNASMKILFNRFNYKCSLYNYEGRIWFMFKQNNNIEQIIEKINCSSDIKYYYKNNFMDYWKT